MKDGEIPLGEVTGELRIRIWVNWQGAMKPVTVFNLRAVLHREARGKAQEFFKTNPCCLQLEPEVTWTVTDHVGGSWTR